MSNEHRKKQGKLKKLNLEETKKNIQVSDRRTKLTSIAWKEPTVSLLVGGQGRKQGGKKTQGTSVIDVITERTRNGGSLQNRNRKMRL